MRTILIQKPEHILLQRWSRNSRQVKSFYLETHYDLISKSSSSLTVHLLASSPLALQSEEQDFKKTVCPNVNIKENIMGIGQDTDSKYSNLSLRSQNRLNLPLILAAGFLTDHLSAALHLHVQLTPRAFRNFSQKRSH